VNKTINPKPILTAIKERLRLGGELQQAQRHYLIDVFPAQHRAAPGD
jgi:hypothetical protein